MSTQCIGITGFKDNANGCISIGASAGGLAEGNLRSHGPTQV